MTQKETPVVAVQNKATAEAGRTTRTNDGPCQVASAQDIRSLLSPRGKGDKTW